MLKAVRPARLAVAGVAAVGVLCLFIATGGTRGGPASGSRPAAPTSAPSLARKLAADCRTHADKMLAKMDKSFRAVVRPPFVVIGNLPEAKLATVTERSVLRPARALWKGYCTGRPNQVITALLFKDDKTYRRWARQLYGDTDVPHFGYCRGQDGTMVMNINTGTGTLVHELTHALIVYDFAEVPTWFNEGFASLHEQCYIKPDVIVGLTNWRLPALQRAIKARKLRSLSDLIAADDFYRNQSGLNYAQARYFTLYMQQKKLLKKFYAAFRARRGKQAVKTIEEVFGKPLKEIEPEFIRWVLTLKWGR